MARPDLLTLGRMLLSRPLLRASWQAWWSNELDAPGPAWLSWLWTALFALALGTLITLIGFAQHARGDDWTDAGNWRHWFGVNLFISALVSTCVHLSYALALRAVGKARVRQWPDGRRHLLFSVVTVLAVGLSWPLAVHWSGFELNLWGKQSQSGQVGLGSLLFVLLLSVLFNVHAASRARALAAQRREANARLQLLQAQIEPHFLFNSLAHVVSLIDTDPARAKALLESFTDYLRASLSGLRQAEHSLGDELRLVQAYLQVQGHRMAHRLRVHIDVPEALLGLSLPALLLQPLVENAVVHGLEPTVDGGTVTVKARVQDDRLWIDVDDDGQGLGPSAHPRGSGTALLNIRERLKHHVGGQASLDMHSPDLGGTHCRLDLPLPTPRETPP
jgi:signal transduction histidine kinase